MLKITFATAFTAGLLLLGGCQGPQAKDKTKVATNATCHSGCCCCNCTCTPDKMCSADTKCCNTACAATDCKNCRGS